MNSPGGAESQHEASNDFKNKKRCGGRASSGNMGVKGTEGLRRWSQVVCLEVRATVLW